MDSSASSLCCYTGVITMNILMISMFYIFTQESLEMFYLHFCVFYCILSWELMWFIVMNFFYIHYLYWKQILWCCKYVASRFNNNISLKCNRNCVVLISAVCAWEPNYNSKHLCSKKICKFDKQTFDSHLPLIYWLQTLSTI